MPGQGIPGFIADAVSEHSLKRPRRLVVKVQGAGSQFIAAPTGWVDGFSTLDQSSGVRRVDGKDYTAPPIYVQEAAYFVTRGTDGAPQIRLAWAPSASDDVVFEFTAPHSVTATTSTIETGHETAIADLAAALILEAVCLKLADLSMEGANVDLSLGDLAGRGSLLERRAKTYRQRYAATVGVSDQEAAGGGGQDDGSGISVAHTKPQGLWMERRPYGQPWGDRRSPDPRSW